MKYWFEEQNYFCLKKKIKKVLKYDNHIITSSVKGYADMRSNNYTPD